MSGTPNELAVNLAALDERMKTVQAKCTTDILRLAEDSTKREQDNLHWQIGLWIAAVAIRWPTRSSLSNRAAARAEVWLRNDTLT